MADEGPHMKSLNLGRIAVVRPVGTGVAIQASGFAAGCAGRAADMLKAGVVSEAARRMRIDRAGFHAGFPYTCIAKVNRFVRDLHRNLIIEQQCAAIAVPQAIFGVHEDTERRRF